MVKVDDLKNMKFTVGGRPADGKVTFLPEPDRRPRRYTLVSVDDHLVEPPDMFEGRMPKGLADRAPHVVEDESGTQAWVYEGQRYPNLGFNAVVGRPIEECGFEPQRFDEMRPGAWQIDARIADMDIDGVYASLNFPSALIGFAGQRLQQATDDPDLALAIVRANNDWHLEEWAGPHPDRIIPCQIPYLLDPEVAASEIRRNAERGFRAVTFSEAPHKLGLPSIHSTYWDPFLRACEETDTVVCLHIGSAGESPSTGPDAPPDTIGILFFGYAMFSAVDWLFSMIPVRFPRLKILMAEGGIGWVPGLLDRLDHAQRYQAMYGTWTSAIGSTPAEVLKRNFWFCALDDPSTFAIADRIGIENITLESDYPHLDCAWPDTQSVIHRQVKDRSPDEIAALTWRNASQLLRHPVPSSVVADPESF